jgi:hypothetical protein
MQRGKSCGIKLGVAVRSTIKSANLLTRFGDRFLARCDSGGSSSVEVMSTDWGCL